VQVSGDVCYFVYIKKLLIIVRLFGHNSQSADSFYFILWEYLVNTIDSILDVGEALGLYHIIQWVHDLQ